LFFTHDINQHFVARTGRGKETLPMKKKRLSSCQDPGASCQSMVGVARQHELCPDDYVHEIAENTVNVAGDAIGKQRAC